MPDSLDRLTITRRTALAGALGTAALAAGGPALAQAGGRKPNMLYIMADDLGYADLSCYGRRDYADPGARRAGGRGHDVHARLCQQRGVHGDARGADHRPLPVSPAGRAAGAARRGRRRPARPPSTRPWPRCCATPAIAPR